MFKTKHDIGSPNYNLNTPKIPSKALPQSPPLTSPRSFSRAEHRSFKMLKPSLSGSISRAHTPKPSTPLPLKSILKGKTSPPRDSYESDGEVAAAKKGSRNNVYTVPNSPPQHAHLGPMKGPALNLHWKLLPYHPKRSKRFLHFDVAFPTHDIEFRQNSSYGVQRTSLSDADFDKSAADEKLVKMTINFQRGPFEWDIDVKRDRGIRVRDVFEAIHAAFDAPLTPHEKSLIPHHRRAVYEEAFRLRCKLAAGLPIVEQRKGWKRVDMLLHETLFRGLTQPKSGGDWVLNLSGSVPVYDR
ncbi:uncharacterized protein F5147DRAFT_837876 [Suillus discolor]|uniref:DUF6699 domain-containing protein n=1 Tax=Suillus discolor TaxID=1912936 RepID=A0A9P7F3X1_9AGAM|nr:uncharacterized protein F5147DRAFT_837876 [Suillus discolor]KAG2106658.1 hypothetical protein F5147DRAFT_837876 [Suillus discolor]